MNSPHDTGASVQRFALPDAKKPPPGDGRAPARQGGLNGASRSSEAGSRGRVSYGQPARGVGASVAMTWPVRGSVVGADGAASTVRAGGDFGAVARTTGACYVRALVPGAGHELGWGEYWTPLGLFVGRRLATAAPTCTWTRTPRRWPGPWPNGIWRGCDGGGRRCHIGDRRVPENPYKSIARAWRPAHPEWRGSSAITPRPRASHRAC
jgi:hypothetical protein